MAWSILSGLNADTVALQRTGASAQSKESVPAASAEGSTTTVNVENALLAPLIMINDKGQPVVKADKCWMWTRAVVGFGWWKNSERSVPKW